MQKSSFEILDEYLSSQSKKLEGQLGKKVSYAQVICTCKPGPHEGQDSGDGPHGGQG